MESFIRSKYESRRWAKDGPPPSDPSILENDVAPTSVSEIPQRVPSPSSVPQHNQSQTISHRQSPSATISRQPQSHQLLSTSLAHQKVAPAAQAPVSTPAPQPAAPENDLFALDFRSPAPISSSTPSAPTQQPPKNVKQDILSLFSTPSAAPASNFASLPQQTSPWGNPQLQPSLQPTGLMGTNGVGMWGASSGWNPAPTAAASQQSTLWGHSPALSQQPNTVAANTPGAGLFQQGNLWANTSSATQAQQPNEFAGGSDIWGSTNTANQDLFGSSLGTVKKDDAFVDIWGGFK